MLFSFHPKQEKLIVSPSPGALNAEDEKAAILQTIEDETNSFYRRDYASWKKFWLVEIMPSRAGIMETVLLMQALAGRISTTAFLIT